MRFLHSLAIAALLALSVPAFGQATQPIDDAGASCPVPHDTSAGAPQLPAGHPAIGSAPAMGQLPEGHPPMDGAAPDAPVGEPVPAQLAIRAVQGTAGGPAIAGDEVTVQLHSGHQVLKELKTRLDDHGVVMLENLTIDRPVRPLVTITHKGVAYDAVGGMLTPQQPRAAVDVTVHEPTDQAPAWTIQMRHVMVHSSGSGLQVSEVVVIDNPSDKTWMGTPAPVGSADDAKRQTIWLALPHDLQKVQIISGFHDCCATLEHGRLASGMPLLPGQHQFRFAYEVPATAGQAQIVLSAPVPTERLMVFLPDDSTTVTAQNLESLGSASMGSKSARLYRADQLAADQPVGFTVDGLSALPTLDQAAATTPSAPAAMSGNSDSATAAKAMVGIGGGIAVVAVLAIILVKGRKQAPAY